MSSISELCKQFETEVDTHPLNTVLAYFSSPTKKILLTRLKDNSSLLPEIGKHIFATRKETPADYVTKMTDAWEMFLQEYCFAMKISYTDILFHWAKEAHVT